VALLPGTARRLWRSTAVGFFLAEAGPLNGYRATVHWEVLQLLEERYPEVQVTEALFVADRRCITCAGGIAALGMMLHLIQTKHGEGLAQTVANGFVHFRLLGRLPGAGSCGEKAAIVTLNGIVYTRTLSNDNLHHNGSSRTRQR
jgi:hypothetical protein